MKIRYDFFKEVMQGKYTNIIFSTPQMFGMICQAIKILFQELTCMVIFFFTTSIQQQRTGPWLGYKTTKVTCQCKEDSSMRLIHKDHILSLILSFLIETDCLSVLF